MQILLFSINVPTLTEIVLSPFCVIMVPQLSKFDVFILQSEELAVDRTMERVDDNEVDIIVDSFLSRRIYINSLKTCSRLDGGTS